MAPILQDQSQSLVEIGAALAYPLLDLLLLGVLVRLLLAPGRQAPAMRLVVGGFVAFLMADYPYAIMALTDTYEVGLPVDAGWMIGAVLWGASALHPSMREIARPVPDQEVRFSAWRLLVLTGASLMAPAVLVVEWLSGMPIDVPAVAAGSVVLFMLVIARLATVVGDLRSTLAQRSLLERELERRALHDPLTGLANRVLFLDRLQHALARRDGSVAVMFLDLDDFKTVNDAYGHAAGDMVLRAVADSLRDSLRPQDTVARLGGDEFAVLLTDSPNQFAASLMAGRLLEAVQRPVTLAGGHDHRIGASIGITLGAGSDAASPTGVAGSAEALMRDADIAMYVAKGQGKGIFTIFEPTEHQSVVRGLELRNDLLPAIQESQFRLLYQPIFDLDSGAVAGVEALVRWQHPTQGLLDPPDFIPLAEATGAIVPLGRWILDEAVREAASWDGPDAPRVGVNLSAVQLADPAFPGLVTDALARTGLPPSRLTLELTETARLDVEVAARALHELRELGVRLAIDDFGTGYAALTHLSRTPFDVLKIDGSFIAPIATDANARALVEGILDLARRLGIPVVAEGIESGAQLARLRAAGCAMGQGFHLARPMPPEQLHALLLDGAPALDRPRRSRARLPRTASAPTDAR
jgi:diguanylate cyclase (GGDEF)-like protein